MDDFTQELWQMIHNSNDCFNIKQHTDRIKNKNTYLIHWINMIPNILKNMVNIKPHEYLGEILVILGVRDMFNKACVDGNIQNLDTAIAYIPTKEILFTYLMDNNWKNLYNLKTLMFVNDNVDIFKYFTSLTDVYPWLKNDIMDHEYSLLKISLRTDKFKVIKYIIEVYNDRQFIMSALEYNDFEILRYIFTMDSIDFIDYLYKAAPLSFTTFIKRFLDNNKNIQMSEKINGYLY